MLVFLVIALFAAYNDLKQIKSFRAFMWTYNIGVSLTAAMLVVRGIRQVLGLTMSKAADASISGIAGIGHILTGVGIICCCYPSKSCQRTETEFMKKRPFFM